MCVAQYKARKRLSEHFVLTASADATDPSTAVNDREKLHRCSIIFRVLILYMRMSITFNMIEITKYNQFQHDFFSIIDASATHPSPVVSNTVRERVS